MVPYDVVVVTDYQKCINDMRDIDDIWQNYLQLPEAGETWILRRYNKMLYQAFNSVENKRFDDAIKVYDCQLQLIDTTQYSRLIYFTHVEKAKVHAMKNDYRRAIEALERTIVAQARTIAMLMEKVEEPEEE